MSSPFSTLPHLRGGTGVCVRRALALTLLGTILLTGCTSQPESEPVRSHLEGRVTVSRTIDSTADYSKFRLLVVEANGRRVDTLGHVKTSESGAYEMIVEAPRRGIYPLIVWGRSGEQRLFTTEYVVADGDSGTLNLEFPLRSRRLSIRSEENSALQAYRNTMAQHRQNLVERLQSASYDETPITQSVRLTSSILWGMRKTYPETHAAALASVESLALLEGWNDSLVVARAREIEPSNPRFVEAARIGRRSQARLQGQEAALEYVQEFRRRAATEAQRAAIQAVVVQSHMDSLQAEQAVSAARGLQRRHPGSEWAEWADRAVYEVENLLPGMTLPDLRVRTTWGDSLSLDSLRGRPVVLEFYQPGEDLFIQQIPTRNALYEATRTDSVAFLSVSLEPDTVLNQAFFDGRRLPGRHVIAPGGPDGDLAQRYNIAVSPTRILVDSEGKLVDKYVGTAFLRLQSDLAQMVEGDLSTPRLSSPPSRWQLSPPPESPLPVDTTAAR